MSSKAVLTAKRLRAIRRYCPQTGNWSQLEPTRQGQKKSDPTHPDVHGYLRMHVDGRRYLAHRLAWLYMTGDWPKQSIDHINGDRQDNRWINLRDVSHSTNCQNTRRASKNSALGVQGVKSMRGRFQTRIAVGERRIHLGTFDTPEEASAAYVQAKRALHEGCTL